MHIQKKSIFLLAAIIAYIASGFFFVHTAAAWLSEEYLAALTGKAVDIAHLAAQSYALSNGEAAELRALAYQDVSAHPAARRLERLFTGEGFTQDIVYAYVTAALQPEEIKYRVTAESAARDGAAPGTPLNLIRLVEANLGGVRAEGAAAVSDRDRYTWMRGGESGAYDARPQDGAGTDAASGGIISGTAPLYTTEGQFAGMLTVDMKCAFLENRTRQTGAILVLLFLIPSAVLSAAYLSIFRRSRRRNWLEASIDELTGLGNRRLLAHSLPRMVAEHYENVLPLSVIMLDIDLFKPFNDNHGHPKGDLVLEEIALALRSVLRQGMDILCRYGGEEFILLLPGTDRSAACHVAEKIRQAVNEMCIPHGYSAVAPHVTVSQGIFTAIPGGTGCVVEQQYIDRADKALYIAKREGRNRYHVWTAGEAPL